MAVVAEVGLADVAAEADMAVAAAAGVAAVRARLVNGSAAAATTPTGRIDCCATAVGWPSPHHHRQPEPRPSFPYLAHARKHEYHARPEDGLLQRNGERQPEEGSKAA